MSEIKILRFLDHPNIIKIYEFYQDEKNFYLIIEMCVGGELFEKILEHGYFSEKEASKKKGKGGSQIKCSKNSTKERPPSLFS